MGKIKSKKEIEAMIKKGEKFIAKHPHSMFGTDNVKGLEIFKRLAKRLLAGESIETLREETHNYDPEDEEGEAFCAAVDWLSGYKDELY